MDVVLELPYNTHTLVERRKIKFLFMEKKNKKKTEALAKTKIQHKNNYTFGETKNIKWFNNFCYTF